MDESKRTPKTAQKNRQSKILKPEQTKIKINRKHANFIRKYCLENNLSLCRFFNLLLTNVFLNKRFTLEKQDTMGFRIAHSVEKILKIIEPDTPIQIFTEQAVKALFEDLSLLPDPPHFMRYIKDPKKGDDLLHSKNSTRLRKTYQKRQKNPPKNLIVSE